MTLPQSGLNIFAKWKNLVARFDVKKKIKRNYFLKILEIKESDYDLLDQGTPMTR